MTSGKVSKKAVVRNLLRRRGYAAAAKILPQLKKPVWVAVFFQPSAVRKTLAEIQGELKEILL